MSDRELLVMAARASVACGIPVLKHGSSDEGFIKNRGESWRPLYDDGDALRLMVCTRSVVRICAGAVMVDFPAINEKTLDDFASICEPVLDDYQASVRRAIVRAAAEIGKSMIDAQ